jgi:hypothetical protein
MEGFLGRRERSVPTGAQWSVFADRQHGKSVIDERRSR